MQFMNKYIGKFWAHFCVTFVLLTFEALCDLMQPTIMAKIIDVGVTGKKNKLRSDLFRKIQTFSFENIDKFDRAYLVTRLTNDAM